MTGARLPRDDFSLDRDPCIVLTHQTIFILFFITQTASQLMSFLSGAKSNRNMLPLCLYM